MLTPRHYIISGFQVFLLESIVRAPDKARTIDGKSTPACGLRRWMLEVPTFASCERPAGETLTSPLAERIPLVSTPLLAR